MYPSPGETSVFMQHLVLVILTVVQPNIPQSELNLLSR